MIALSIRQPWAWLILNAGKGIENRTWPTKFRGRFLIHAAKGCTFREHQEAVSFMRSIRGQSVAMAPSRWASALDQDRWRAGERQPIEYGGIVGEVEIVDCVRQSDSPWFTGAFMGHYGFVLRDPKPLPFRPMPGRPGFFEAAA
jgi:hypothetical protein